jgi:pyrroloquinoline quinone biosynthesis protein B
VLGTAQDGGLPHVACTCPHCEAARHDASKRRGVASIAVVDPAAGLRFLVDATPDIREELDRLPAVGDHPTGRVDRRPVDGVILTHAHVGHILGLALFGFEAVHTHAMPVYATPPLAAYLRANGPFARMVARDEIDIRVSPPGTTFALSDRVRVTPFAVPHRDEDSDTVGFKIVGPKRTLVYVPDTDGWDVWRPPLTEVLRGVDVALLDGTFFSSGELPGRAVSSIGHPLIPNTMDRLDALVHSGDLRVEFTHLNHSNDAVDRRSRAYAEILRRGFFVAEDGERVPL